jgi:hypothetical protein
VNRRIESNVHDRPGGELLLSGSVAITVLRFTSILHFESSHRSKAASLSSSIACQLQPSIPLCAAMVALSSIFSPTTISGIQWPLGPGSSPPLHFQTLQELQSIRKPKGSPIDDVLKDLPGTVEDLFSTQGAEERHFGKIALALLLLGYGYTDECHNLITPMRYVLFPLSPGLRVP